MKETRKDFENLYAEEIAEELELANNEEEVIAIEVPAYIVKQAIEAKLRQDKLTKIGKKLAEEEKYWSQKSNWAPSNCHKQLKFGGQKLLLLEKVKTFNDYELTKLVRADIDDSIIEMILSDFTRR